MRAAPDGYLLLGADSAADEDPRIEIVALKVIEIARTGERDAQRIRDLTLRAFNQDQRSG